MRCLIIHNPASGPSSDEIYAFTHALAQGGDEVVMRFTLCVQAIMKTILRL